MLYFRNLTIVLFMCLLIPIAVAIYSGGLISVFYFIVCFAIYSALLLLGLIYAIFMPKTNCPGCNTKIIVDNHVFCRKCGTRFDYNLFTKRISNVFIIEDLPYVKAMEKKESNRALRIFITGTIIGVSILIIALKYFESAYTFVVLGLMLLCIPLGKQYEKTRFKAN